VGACGAVAEGALGSALGWAPHECRDAQSSGECVCERGSGAGLVESCAVLAAPCPLACGWVVHRVCRACAALYRAIGRDVGASKGGSWAESLLSWLLFGGCFVWCISTFSSV